MTSGMNWSGQGQISPAPHIPCCILGFPHRGSKCHLQPSQTPKTHWLGGIFPLQPGDSWGQLSHSKVTGFCGLTAVLPLGEDNQCGWFAGQHCRPAPHQS